MGALRNQIDTFRRYPFFKEAFCGHLQREGEREKEREYKKTFCRYMCCLCIIKQICLSEQNWTEQTLFVVSIFSASILLGFVVCCVCREPFLMCAPLDTSWRLSGTGQIMKD